jgi:ribosomal protein L7/L12
MTFLAGPAYASPFMISEMEKNKKPEQCDVFLRECGPRKIDVMKLLRSYKVPFSYVTLNRKEYKERTLGEAKAIVEKPLSLMYEDIHYYDASDIKKTFEALGAKVDIVVITYTY